MLTNDKLIDNRKYHDEYVKSLNSFSDIQNIFPGVKTKFNEIDFSKFWLYNKNGYRYGGVDEWTFDNFNGFDLLRNNSIPTWSSSALTWWDSADCEIHKISAALASPPYS